MTQRVLRRWVVGVVAAQVAFLLGWAGYHEQVRREAPTVLLKTRPVDPRDLLRGDYMILGYEIADPPVLRDSELAAGEEIWVLLAKRGDYHEAIAWSRHEPRTGPGQIAVRATRTWNGLEFGIERFFVPEGRGTPTFSRLEVEASVSPAARLYVRRVLLDGKTFP